MPMLMFMGFSIAYFDTDTKIKLIQTINMIQSTHDEDKAATN